MKKLFNIIIIIAGLLFFTACDRNSGIDVPDPKLKVIESRIIFDEAGGAGYIMVSAPGQVTAQSDQDWCKANVSGATINLTVDENTSLGGRSATVTINWERETTHVTAVQKSSIGFIIDRTTLDAVGRASTLKTAILHKGELTIISNNDWLQGVMVGDTLVITVEANPQLLNSRTGTIDVKSGSLVGTITVRQASNLYDGLLGDYTMSYATSNAVPINRTRTSTVTLVEGIEGETYYLKGVLNDTDEALGNIIVSYNESKRELEIRGQILFQRPGTTNDFWWLPYSQPVSGSNYTSRSTTYGMLSAIEISGTNVSFTMKDNGLWPAASGPDYLVAGFLLRNYDGATSLGNVNGKDGQAFCFYPMFEKQ